MSTAAPAQDVKGSTFNAMSELTGNIGDPSLSQIQRGFRERTFSAGTKILKQGEFQDFFFIIQSGRARTSRSSVQGKESTISMLGSGDEIGLSGIFSDSTSTSCVALDDLVVLYCTRDTLIFLMQEIPGLAYNVARILARRVEQLEDRASSFSGGALPRRLSIALLRLSDEGTVSGKEVQLAGSITHDFLASLVGASREAVTLALGKLRDVGAVRQVGKGTIIVVPVVLNEIAGTIK